MNNKWIAGGGVGLLAVAVAGPFATGWVAQKKIESLIATLNQQSQSVVKIESYHRGYLASDVDILLTSESQELSQMALRLRTHLSHGIASVKAMSTLHLPDEWANSDEVKSVLQGRPLATLDVEAGYLAGVSLSATSIAINYKDAASEQSALIHPIEINLQMPISMDESHLAMSWQGMSLQQQNRRLQISRFGLTQAATKVTPHIWGGKVNMTLDSARLGIADNEKAISALTISSDTSPSAGKRLSTDILVHASQVTLNGQEYGDQRLSMGITGIAIDELEHLIAAAENMDRQMNTSNPIQQAEQEEKQFNLFIKAGTELLRRGMVASVNELVLSTPYGPISGKATLTQPETKPGDKSPLLKATSGFMELSAPVQLLLSFAGGEQQVAALVEQNIMVQEGERLKSVATLKDSYVMLNGQQIPIPPLF